MIVRLRFPQGRLVKRQRTQARELAIASMSLLPLVCGMMYTLAFWQLAADLGVAREAGSQGFFGHWQVWIALALAAQLTTQKLSRRFGSRSADKIVD